MRFSFDVFVRVSSTSVLYFFVTEGMPRPMLPPTFLVASTLAAFAEGATRTSPAPMREIGVTMNPSAVGVRFVLSAPLSNRALMTAGVAFGNFWMSSAAAPETTGAAPEVPPKLVSSVAVPVSADSHAPGAPMSGFARWSSHRESAA